MCVILVKEKTVRVSKESILAFLVKQSFENLSLLSTPGESVSKLGLNEQCTVGKTN